MRGLVTPLEMVASYLRPVWAPEWAYQREAPYQREARRRRAANPAKASRESVAVVGSGIDAVTVNESVLLSYVTFSEAVEMVLP